MLRCGHWVCRGTHSDAAFRSQDCGDQLTDASSRYWRPRLAAIPLSIKPVSLGARLWKSEEQGPVQAGPCGQHVTHCSHRDGWGALCAALTVRPAQQPPCMELRPGLVPAGPPWGAPSEPAVHAGPDRIFSTILDATFFLFLCAHAQGALSSKEPFLGPVFLHTSER